MSNPLKSVGKVFRKVVKFVKKIALPVIAVAAVVLTGGAALGVFGATGLAGLAGSVGLSATSGLGAVLISAAKAATFGAVTSAVMGKNPIKGATMGFMTGGLLGAVGALPGGTGPMSALGLGKSAAEQAAASQLANGAAGVTSQAMSNVGAINAAGSAAVNGTAPALAGAGAASAAPIASSGFLTPAAEAAASAAPAASAAAPATVGGGVAQTAGATTAAQTAAGAGNSGFLSGMFNDPMTTGMLIQGAGTGFSALAASKDASKERKQYAKNYEGIAGSVFRLPQNNAGAALPDAGRTFNNRMFGRVVWDPRLADYVEERP